jgi:hypothetical protein
MKFDHPAKEKLIRVNKYGIIGVFAAVLFIIIEINILISNSNTYNVVFAFDGYFDEESQDMVKNAMEEAVTEAYPGNKIKVKIDWLFFDPVSDPDSFNKLTTLLAQDNYYLFIMSDQPRKISGSEGESIFPGLSSMICSRGWFDPLKGFGLSTDTKYDSRVRLNNTALFQQLGVGDIEFYASIIDWSGEGAQNKNVSYALSIVNYLLNSK